MNKYNLNYKKLNNSLSSSNEFFVDEFSLNASRTLSFLLIENDASLKQINKNSQINNIALIKWKNEEFSKKFFFLIKTIMIVLIFD